MEDKKNARPPIGINYAQATTGLVYANTLTYKAVPFAALGFGKLPTNSVNPIETKVTKTYTKDYSELSSSQPVAGVVVQYQGDAKKTVEALSPYGEKHISSDDGGLLNATPVLNRYAWGSGRFRWRPTSNGTFTILDYEKQLETKDLPFPGKTQQVFAGDSEYHKPWRQYARESDGGDWYNVGNLWSVWDFTTGESDEALRAIGQSPVTQNVKYTYHFNKRFDTSANVTTSKAVESVELFLPISGLNYTDINLGPRYGSRNLLKPIYDNYIISGITTHQEDIATRPDPNDTAVASEAIPYVYATQKINEINFDWSLKSAKYLLNYWDQIGYYGYDQTSNEYLPTQYVALSDINNPTYVPNTKLIDSFDSNNSPITKTIAWKNNLVIFTSTSTSLAIGRVPETKELVHSDVGVTTQYRDTVQVVSDSIVFKNQESVFAFVPTPGTDNATSLRVRDIASQIKEILIDLETEHKDNFEVTSTTLHNGHYWLIYKLKDVNKTVIFKYDWTNYAWTMDSYDTAYKDVIKLDNDTVVATTEDGTIFEFLSDDMIDWQQNMVDRWTDFKTNSADSSVDSDYIKLKTWYKQNALDEYNARINQWPNGDMVSWPGNAMDVYSDRSLFTSTVPTTKGSQQLASTLHGFNEVKVPYTFVLGNREVSTDGTPFFEEVSVGIGSKSKTPILGQTLSTYVDNMKVKDINLTVGGETQAVVHTSERVPWTFRSSMYSKPTVSYTATKILKTGNTIDMAISGEVADRLHIDSVTFTYRRSVRKNYRN